MAIPSQSLLQGKKYTPSYKTDIRRLFKQVKQEQKKGP